MLTIRQENVLGIIIDEYIKTVEPVSSQYICDILNVSSATVRNEMSFLEKQGFIEKTHFASGRIPTEVGYRYYVEKMINESNIKIDKKDSLRVRELFDNNGLVLKDAVYESVKLISELTNYSVVMLGSSSKHERLKQVKVVSVDDHSVVSIIVTSSGNVFNQVVSIDEDLDMKELEQAVETINDLLIDTPLSKVNYKLENDIKPILSTFISQHQTLYEAFVASIIAISKNRDVKYQGQDKLIGLPEFDDIDLVRKFVKQLNDETLIKLISYSDEISVKIGNENNVSDDLSVVTTIYHTDCDEASIAVIGPKRMDYNKVLGLLQEIEQNLKRIKEENSNE